MTRCDNCHGEGLVGQGDQPWLRQGRIDTCTKCNGTGKIDDDEVAPEVETVPEPEPVKTEETTPVDSDPLAEAPSVEASSDGSNADGASAPETV